MPTKRKICFVTGTRAEWGLMRPVLEAIRRQGGLQLQIVVTGMHLDSRHGLSLRQIRREGWKIDAVAPWRTPRNAAAATGAAMEKLARIFEKLKPDIVLIVGDRVEAFAAAAAGHISGRIIAHVHGGDRALGQIDDSLRHAITKLSHIHFPATADSGRRIGRLGEDPWRIHVVGSPAIDGIRKIAAPWNYLGLPRRRFAILALHPIEADEAAEYRRAKIVLAATAATPFDRIVIIFPNNDPGSGGIIRCWEEQAANRRLMIYRDLPRQIFLGLLRDAAAIVGNSSSGIIEASSFGTPAVDIGPRQLGRLRCEDVTNVPYRQGDIHRRLTRIWNHGQPRRSSRKSPYGKDGAGAKIAAILHRIDLGHPLRRKLIAY